MQMLMWSWGRALSTFYLTCPLFSLSTSVYIRLCLHLCITVIYLSILWKSQGVYFTLCYFLLIFVWLVLPSQTFEFPLLVSYILDCSFNSLFFVNLEKDALFYIHCFISDKQCDHSQLRNLLHFKLLLCKRGWAPLLPTPLRFYEKEWVRWQH